MYKCKHTFLSIRLLGFDLHLLLEVVEVTFNSNPCRYVVSVTNGINDIYTQEFPPNMCIIPNVHNIQCINKL